ncbi:MAG: hypothetical protein ABIG91_04080 [Patescibacteria group bacterium]
MNKFQTLHSHTTNSDGQLSYIEILRVCEENNIGVVAFTDHDSLIDEKSLEELRDYKGDTKWISGIEISSGFPRELGGKATSGLHIVGLFVDPTNEKLLNHCRLAKEARLERMRKMVLNLRGLGFEITEKACITVSGGEAVGRPHIVSALFSIEANKNILQELVSKMKKDSDKNPDIKEKYNTMLEQGEEQYPYALFLSENAHIPSIYVEYQYYLDMDSSVKIIRNAGGLAVLAHYFTCVKYLSGEMLGEMLKDSRLDGLETVFGFSGLNTGTTMDKLIMETSDIAKKLVRKYGKIASGGVDAHKLQDFVGFSMSGQYPRSTVGMTEKILDIVHPDLSWSNL